ASGANDLGAGTAAAASHDGRDGLADVADAVAVGVELILVRFGGTVVAGVAQAVAVGVELIGVVDPRAVVREGELGQDRGVCLLSADVALPLGFGGRRLGAQQQPGRAPVRDGACRR